MFYSQKCSLEILQPNPLILLRVFQDFAELLAVVLTKPLQSKRFKQYKPRVISSHCKELSQDLNE